MLKNNPEKFKKRLAQLKAQAQTRQRKQKARDDAREQEVSTGV
jgi:hypothetical protein